MAGALGHLFGHQLAARRDGAILRRVLQCIRADRRSCRTTASRAIGELIRSLTRFDPADEALQPLLLLVVEVAHGSDQAAARTGTR